MRLLFLAVFCCAALDAQTLNFTGLVPVIADFPKTVSIGGTGAIAIGTGDKCTGIYSLCYYISTSLSSPTAPATMTVWINGYGAMSLKPSETPYVATFPVTSDGFSTTVTISYTAVGQAAYPTFSSIAQNGCVATGTLYGNNALFGPGDLDSCTGIGGFPGGPDIADPPQGSTAVDGNFGTVVRTLAPTAAMRQPRWDANKTSWNADGSIIAVANLSGGFYGMNPVTATDVWTNAAMAVQTLTWSATDALSYYYTVGPAIWKRTLTTPPSGHTDTLIYTYPGGGVTAITDGGQCNMAGGNGSKNWWAFFTTSPSASADQKACIIHLDDAEVHCADLSGIPQAWYLNGATYSPRGIQLSKGADIDTGYRYAILSTGGSPGVNENIDLRWKQGETDLTNLGFLQQTPDASTSPTPTYNGPSCDMPAYLAGNCIRPYHYDAVEIAGHQYFVTPYATNVPYVVSVLLFDPANPDTIALPAELGGAAHFITISGPNNASDLHIGCGNPAPVCIMETNSDPSLTSWFVTGATNTSPIVLTLNRAWTGGSTAVIGGVAGNTNANGRFAVTAAGAQLTLTGSTGNGTFLSGTGTVIDGATPTAYQHQGEIWLLDFTHTMDSNSTLIRRLVKHRNWSFSLQAGWDPTGYFGQSHPTISQDGTQFFYESNRGRPEQLGLFGAATGYTGSGRRRHVPSAPSGKE